MNYTEFIPYIIIRSHIEFIVIIEIIFGKLIWHNLVLSKLICHNQFASDVQKIADYHQNHYYIFTHARVLVLSLVLFPAYKYIHTFMCIQIHTICVHLRKLF